MITTVRSQLVAGTSTMLRETFFSAFKDGKPVRLYDARTHCVHDGVVIGVNPESGFMPGQRPEHLLVDIRRLDDGHIITSIYVRLV